MIEYDDYVEFSYTLAKRLPTLKSMNSDYGKIELDDEMKAVIKEALENLLKQRLNENK